MLPEKVLGKVKMTKEVELCCQVHADRLEPWYQGMKDELKAAKKQKRWAERERIKMATTVNKQIFDAARRLAAKTVHKTKSLFFCNEIAIATSSRQLSDAYNRWTGRKSSPLPSMYHLHDLPDVFNNSFLQNTHH